MLANALLVMLGGAVGALGRYLLGLISAKWWVHLNWPYNEWPLGTFLANIIGGLLIGLIMGLLFGPLKDVIASDQVERWRLLLAVGVLGGFTTFSSFSLEVALMLERRAYALAILYVSLSVIVSVAAVALGLFVTRRIWAG
ncbi:MAG: fluoride efflux transporter CrcB [Asticcacaulis sp.]|uniref:fluoride efflux transporter CrcB n=1 Tax=Asticcacaulis sp. TaxID=1872648 RepID=UPI003F7BB8B9